MKFLVRSLLTLVLLPIFPACSADPLPPGTKSFRDLAYVKEPHFRQKLDLYVPEKPTGPLLVYIHGGGWRGGTKDHVQALPMVKFGYCVASVEYRFSQDAIFPAQIEDCKAAIRWLRAHAAEYGYDPKRVAVCGDSAGGHLTALLATTGQVRDFDVGENLEQTSEVQCAVDFYGPTDFIDFRPASDNPAVQPKGKESLLTYLFGGEVSERQELARKASPIYWASKTTAPLLILHGTKDQLVGVDQSQRFAEKLKAEGAEVTLDVIEGAGHGGAEFWAEGRAERFFEFLKQHLAVK